MNPLPITINILFLGAVIVLFGIMTALRQSLGQPGFISSLVILGLTFISAIAAIKARISWERNNINEVSK